MVEIERWVAEVNVGGIWLRMRGGDDNDEEWVAEESRQTVVRIMLPRTCADINFHSAMSVTWLQLVRLICYSNDAVD